MNTNINDKNLSKIVQLKLSAEKKENIDEIEEISIINKDFTQKTLDIDFTEISKIKNLRKLSIKFFEITDNVIECLNQLEHLESIEILMCNFENTKSITKQLKKLIIYNCDNFKIKMLENNITETISIEHSGIIDIFELTKFNLIKKLKVSDCMITSLPKVSMFSNLERLYLNSINLDFEFDISQMKKLKFICLNGSKTQNKEKYIKNLKTQNTNIEIEFEDVDLPIK